MSWNLFVFVFFFQTTSHPYLQGLLARDLHFRHDLNSHGIPLWFLNACCNQDFNPGHLRVRPACEPLYQRRPLWLPMKRGFIFWMSVWHLNETSLFFKHRLLINPLAINWQLQYYWTSHPRNSHFRNFTGSYIIVPGGTLKWSYAKSPGWQPTLCATWCLICWLALSYKKYGHTWHRMSLLRPGVIKQNKPNHHILL